jgi:hypothetical protein
VPAHPASLGVGGVLGSGFQFGPYYFPGTFQETNRMTQRSLARKKIPFMMGEYSPNTTSLAAREISLVADIGPGVYSPAQGIVLATPNDLEAERVLLAQTQIEQAAMGYAYFPGGIVSGYEGPGSVLVPSPTGWPLWIRSDRYINAKLSKFPHVFGDSMGFRVANWKIDFVCDDPRYFGTSIYNSGNNALPGSSQTNSGNITHLGNTKAFPVFLWTVVGGNCIGPKITMTITNGTSGAPGTGSITVQFSNLKMTAGDQLLLNCDIRPEAQQYAALYYPGGIASGVSPINALQYILPANNDFINSLDNRYFFPYIEASSVLGGSGASLPSGTHQRFSYGSTGGVSGTTNLIWAYQDTWL